MENELKIKNEKILKNQLIEALIKYTNLSKDNYDCFENTDFKLRNKENYDYNNIKLD